MKTIKIIIYCMGLFMLTSSCKKDTVSSGNPISTSYNVGMTSSYIRITDAPPAYLAVKVDIQAVEITGNGKVESINMRPGIYNLMDYISGKDTLLAIFHLNMTRVEQIRLILGTNNSVVTLDNVSHPLSTPSAQQSGLKIQVHQNLLPGKPYNILLDFDAGQSVVDEGHGNFLLKPVIRIVEQPISGGPITTSVTPISNHTLMN